MITATIYSDIEVIVAANIRIKEQIPIFIERLASYTKSISPFFGMVKQLRIEPFNT